MSCAQERETRMRQAVPPSEGGQKREPRRMAVAPMEKSHVDRQLRVNWQEAAKKVLVKVKRSDGQPLQFIVSMAKGTPQAYYSLEGEGPQWKAIKRLVKAQLGHGDCAPPSTKCSRGWVLTQWGRRREPMSRSTPPLIPYIPPPVAAL